MGYLQLVPRPFIRQTDLDKPFIWYDRMCRLWRITSRDYNASARSFELVTRSLQAHVRGVERFYVYKDGNSWIADRYNHSFESWAVPVNWGGWAACMNRVCMRLRELEWEKARHALDAEFK